MRQVVAGKAWHPSKGLCRHLDPHRAGCSDRQTDIILLRKSVNDTSYEGYCVRGGDYVREKENDVA